MSDREVLSSANGIGERGKTIGQMAVRKPHNFVTSQHRRRQSAKAILPPALPVRGAPRDPPVSLAEKEYV